MPQLAIQVFYVVYIYTNSVSPFLPSLLTQFYKWLNYIAIYFKNNCGEYVRESWIGENVMGK